LTKHRVSRITAEQLRALSNPTRLEIHTSLRLDGPATAKDLAGRMGVDELGLYYHLRLLNSKGILVAKSRPGATKPETIYAVESRFLVEDLDFNNQKNLLEQCRNVDSLLRAASKEYRSSAQVLRNEFHDRSFVGRLAVRLNRTNEKELRRRLRELSAWLDENASPKGDKYSVSLFVVPLAEKE
jgi:DNA-binding transcriptional ArsR family regulator